MATALFPMNKHQKRLRNSNNIKNDVTDSDEDGLPDTSERAYISNNHTKPHTHRQKSRKRSEYGQKPDGDETLITALHHRLASTITDSEVPSHEMINMGENSYIKPLKPYNNRKPKTRCMTGVLTSCLFLVINVTTNILKKAISIYGLFIGILFFVFVYIESFDILFNYGEFYYDPTSTYLGVLMFEKRILTPKEEYDTVNSLRETIVPYDSTENKVFDRGDSIKLRDRVDGEETNELTTTDKMDMTKTTTSTHNMTKDAENISQELIALKEKLRNHEEYIEKLESQRAKERQHKYDHLFHRMKADLTNVIYVEINEYIKSCDVNVTFTPDDIRLTESGFYSIVIDFWRIMYDDLKMKLKAFPKSPYYEWFERDGDSNVRNGPVEDVYESLKKKSIESIIESVMSDYSEYRCCCKYGKRSRHTCGDPFNGNTRKSKPRYDTLTPSRLVPTPMGSKDNKIKLGPRAIASKFQDDVDKHVEKDRVGVHLGKNPMCLIAPKKLTTEDEFFKAYDGYYDATGYDEYSDLYLSLGIKEDFFNSSMSKTDYKTFIASHFDPYLLTCKLSFVIL